MSFQVGTPNYGLPQTGPRDKRDWSDTNEPFLRVDTDLKYAMDTLENHEVRITALENAGAGGLEVVSIYSEPSLPGVSADDMFTELYSMLAGIDGEVVSTDCWVTSIDTMIGDYGYGVCSLSFDRHDDFDNIILSGTNFGYHGGSSIQALLYGYYDSRYGGELKFYNLANGNLLSGGDSALGYSFKVWYKPN